jgi:Ca-activated chloride channel homolog
MEGRPIWIWAAGAVLALLVGTHLVRGALAPHAAWQSDAGQQAQQGAPAGAIRISIATSSTKQEWMHQAIQAFNAASPRDRSLQVEGRPVLLEVVQEVVDGKRVDYRSGTMVSDTVNGKIKPTILSPSEEQWSFKLRDDWQAVHGTSIAREIGATLARTPLVIATWESRARALGCWPDPGPDCTWQRIRTSATGPDGWGMLGHPEWGRFKFGYGYVGESNSGTVSAALMCMVGAGKTDGLAVADVDAASGCGQFIAGVERAKVHSGNRSGWLIEQMARGGPEYLDAVAISESDVILTNRTRGGDLRERIVSVYPQDGTVLLGHPFTVLDGAAWVTAEQVAAAEVFKRFLLSPEQQRAVAATGLRPGDSSVKLESPIEPLYGANSQARLATLELPDSLVLDRVIEVWHRVKKHAVVALVFDKSGSMAGEKIGAAVKGAQEFVQRMDRDDQLIWIPFDGRVYSPAEGSGAELGEELMGRIASTPAGGGTALYDAILSGYDRLQGMRSVHGDTLRYGIVVLSDGKDTNSGRSLTQLEARLSPQESDPTGVQIHTIAIGKDADERTLKRIANAAHGSYWKGQTVDDMISVYRAIATYY